MFTGLCAGILWGLDTVILGIALAASPFASTEQAVILAPFISTFLHDACSAIWMLIYMGFKRQYKNVVHALKSKSGKFIILGALLGGPIGMSGYVAAVNYIGPAYTAVISAFFPALGAFLAYVFLREKMKPVQIIALLVSIAGIAALGYTPGGVQGKNRLLGFGCVLLCCVGWASEAVICGYGLRDPDITNEQALQIRQLISSLCYGIVILPALKGWRIAFDVMFTGTMATIAAAAFFGTASYVCYYKAIAVIGASKAMALDITYSAWAMLFSGLFLKELPDVRSIICGAVIVLASITAAADRG